MAKKPTPPQAPKRPSRTDKTMAMLDDLVSTPAPSPAQQQQGADDEAPRQSQAGDSESFAEPAVAPAGDFEIAPAQPELPATVVQAAETTTAPMYRPSTAEQDARAQQLNHDLYRLEIPPGIPASAIKPQQQFMINFMERAVSQNLMGYPDDALGPNSRQRRFFHSLASALQYNLVQTTLRTSEGAQRYFAERLIQRLQEVVVTNEMLPQNRHHAYSFMLDENEAGELVLKPIIAIALRNFTNNCLKDFNELLPSRSCV